MNRPSFSWSLSFVIHMRSFLEAFWYEDTLVFCDSNPACLFPWVHYRYEFSPNGIFKQIAFGRRTSRLNKTIRPVCTVSFQKLLCKRYLHDICHRHIYIVHLDNVEVDVNLIDTCFDNDDITTTIKWFPFTLLQGGYIMISFDYRKVEFQNCIFFGFNWTDKKSRFFHVVNNL